MDQWMHSQIDPDKWFNLHHVTRIERTRVNDEVSCVRVVLAGFTWTVYEGPHLDCGRWVDSVTGHASDR